MTTINTEVSRYNEKEFSDLVYKIAWMEKDSRYKARFDAGFLELYNKYFTENYLENVLAWRVFFHSMVKKQKQAKKDKRRGDVLWNRMLLHFLHLMRMYGKECYKKSIQQ